MSGKLYKKYKGESGTGHSRLYQAYQEDLRRGSESGNPMVDDYIARRRQQQEAHIQKQQLRKNRLRRESLKAKQEFREKQDQEMEQRRQATDLFRRDREEIAAGWKPEEPLKSSGHYLRGTAKWKQAKEQERAGLPVASARMFQQDPEAKEIAKRGASKWGGIPEAEFDAGDLSRMYGQDYRTESMTPGEREVYNYLLAKKGRESAKEYQKSLEPRLRERSAEALQKESRRIGEEKPLTGGILVNAAGSLGSGAGYLYALKQKGLGEDTDLSHPYFSGYLAEKETREGVKEHKLPAVSKPVSDFLVDTGLSMTQNLARLPLGNAGLAFAAGGAATGGYRDALERGGTEGEALLSGAAQGTAEGIFEKFSLEGLEGLKVKPPRSVKEFIKNMGKQAFTEGSEEVATELSNSITDYWIMQDRSNYELLKRERMQQGMSEADAAWAARQSIAENIGLAFAGGALSGGVMGGGSQALGIAGQEIYYQGEGRNFNPDFRDYAQGIDTDRESYHTDAGHQKAVELQQLAKEYAQRQNNREAVSNRERGRYAYQLEQFVEEQARGQEEAREIREEQEKRAVPSETGTQETKEGEKPAVAPVQQLEKKAAQQEGQEDGFYKEARESALRQKQQQESAIESLTEEFKSERWRQAGHVAEKLGKNGKQVFEAAYDGSVDPAAFTRAFGRVYDAGRYGQSMELAQQSAILAVLSPEQMEGAFRAGARDQETELPVNPVTRQPINMIKRQTKEGGVSYGTDAATESQKKIAAHLGKMTGLTIELVDRMDQQKVQGSYAKGKITLSVNSQDFLGSATHELTHFIKEYSQDLYQPYRNSVVKALLKAQDTSLEQLVSSYEAAYSRAGQELSRDEIMDEIVADASQKFFNDEEFIKKVMRDNESVGERIVRFLTDVIDAIKELMKTGSTRKAARALEENLRQFETARNIWMVGLEEGSARWQEGWEIEEGQNRMGADAENRDQGEGTRFQLEDVDEANLESRVRDLENENQELREAKELLKEQLKLTPAAEKKKVRKPSVREAAGRIVKNYSSAYDVDKLENQLTRIYEYMNQAENHDLDGLREAATSIGKQILLKSAKVDRELAMAYQDLRKKIRGTKITLAEEDRMDLDAVGGYAAFKRQNLGKIRLVNEGGIAVDSFYQELQGKYPELFPRTVTHQADQLMVIVDALEATGEQITNPYGANMEEMSYLVGQEILDQYARVLQLPPTIADKMEAQKNAAIERYKKKIKKKYDQEFEHLKMLQREVKRDIKSQREQEKQAWNTGREIGRAAQLARNMEYNRNMRARQKAYQDRDTIIKECKTLSDWLIKPNDKKHVPKELQGIVADAILAIDYSSDKTYTNEKRGIFDQPLRRTQMYHEIAGKVEKILQNGGITEDGDFVDLDPDIAGKIKVVAKALDEVKRLDDLTPEELRGLKEITRSLRMAVTEVNRLKSNARYRNVADLADGMIEDAGAREDKKEYVATKEASKLFQSDMLDPFTFFEVLGPRAQTIQQSLRAGQDKKVGLMVDAQNYIKETLQNLEVTQKEIDEWTGPKAKRKEVKTANGTMEMTVGEMMELYAVERQEQAKKHIYMERKGLGIKRRPRVKQGGIQNGKYLASEIVGDNYPVRMTMADVKAIFDTLTEKQKKLADALQHFMEFDCGKWGNEATMAMYGYEKFGASGYYPIRTDSNYIASIEGDFKNAGGSIKNLGFTKERQPHANAPIIIGDIFETWANHVDQMSTYNAFLAPVTDMNKILNYRQRSETDVVKIVVSMKDVLKAKYGSQAAAYWTKYIEDINGTTRAADSSVQDKWIRRMKAASVLGNVRVALQQPTAIMRAITEVDPVYIARGIATMPELNRKNLWDTMCKYAPIVKWKEWGFYRMDTSRSFYTQLFGTDTKLNKINNKMGVLAEQGDALTWKRLWMALEYETQAKHKELKVGSEEYYQQVGARMGEVIDRTQVVDSVLHRTQIMRSNNTMVNMATAFMAEPLKTYNMEYRAVYEANQERKAGNKKKAAKILTVAAAAHVVNCAATAAAAGIQDAFRDDDRDKDWGEKWLENFLPNFLDSIVFLNNIPYVKDAMSVIQGNDLRRTDMQWMTDIGYAINRIAQKKNGDSKYTWKHIALYSLQQSSSLLGVPIKALTRDIGAYVDSVMDTIGGETDYQWLKMKYDIKSNANFVFYINMMLKAYRDGDGGLQKSIRNDFLKAGYSNEEISDKIKSIVRAELISSKQMDPRVEEAARARVKLDEETYKANVQMLVNDGYDIALVQSAVKSAYNKMTDSEEAEIDIDKEMEEAVDTLYEDILNGRQGGKIEFGTIYEHKDVVRLVEKFDGSKDGLQEFNRVADSIVESKMKEGKKKGEAISGLKSSITSKYKQEFVEAYRKGDKKRCEDIQNRLKYLRVKGETLYSGNDWNRWIQDANK